MQPNKLAHRSTRLLRKSQDLIEVSICYSLQPYNARIDRVRAENITMSDRVDRALRSNALFVFSLVLVLSIAVLVLDRFLRYRFRPLDQPSQHRHDPFQIGFPNSIQFGIDCVKQQKDIVDRGAFQCGATGNLEKPILVLRLCFPLPSAMFSVID
jgi:hypothetical protein